MKKMILLLMLGCVFIGTSIWPMDKVSGEDVELGGVVDTGKQKEEQESDFEQRLKEYEAQAESASQAAQNYLSDNESGKESSNDIGPCCCDLRCISVDDESSVCCSIGGKEREYDKDYYYKPSVICCQTRCKLRVTRWICAPCHPLILVPTLICGGLITLAVVVNN